MSPSIHRGSGSAGPAAAILILLAALAGLGVRLAFPAIGARPELVQSYLGAFLDRPVCIGRVQAEWRGWRPYLRIRDLQVMDATGSRAFISFTEARLRVNLWDSMWSRTLTLGGLVLLGGDFTLVRTAEGRITIEGIDTPSDKLLRWLLTQPEVLIESQAIAWHDRLAGHGVWALPHVSVRGGARGGQARVELRVRLPAAAGERLHMVLRGRGEPTSAEWNGEVYLEARGINPQVLLAHAGENDVASQGGALSLRAWTEWRRGRLAAATGALEAAGLILSRGDRTLELPGGSARFHLVGDDAGTWRLGADRLRLTTANGQWPEGRFGVILGPQDSAGRRPVTGYASVLRVHDLWPWWVALAPPEPELLATLEGLAPEGELRELRLAYRPRSGAPAQWSLRAELDMLATKPHDRLPGIAGLSGLIEADADGARLRLPRGPLRVEAPKLYAAPLAITDLRGELLWRREGDGWRLSTPGLRAVNPDLALHLEGMLRGGAEREPEAKLYARVADARLERLEAYLPRALPKAARGWLARAVKGGRIHSATAVLRGPLARFPFDGPNGRFAAELDVIEGVLDYAPGWPAIEGIAARVTFDGRTLEARGEGRVEGAVLKELEVQSPDLAAAPLALEITGTATGTAAEAQRFVANSPLHAGLGPQLLPLKVDGKLSLDLKLQFPLDAESGGASGVVTLPGNTLKSGDYRLTGLRGALRFDRDRWRAEGLRAELYDRPVEIDLEGGRGEGTVRLRGRADRTFIRERLGALLRPGDAGGVARWLAALSGETDWELLAERYLPGTKVGTAFRLRSTLVGLRSALPPPLDKGAAESAPLEIRSSLKPSGEGRVSLAYADRLSAELTLGPEGTAKRIRAAAVTLGGTGTRLGRPADTKALETGLSVGGRLERLSLSAWSALLGHSERNPAPTHRLWDELSADLSIDKLEAYGFVFIDQRIRARTRAGQRLVDLHGPDVEGSLLLRGPAAGQAVIEAELERLRLVRPPGWRSFEKTDPRRLPALSLQCADLRYEAVSLGAVRLRTQPWAKGLSVPELSFSAPSFKLNGLGVWEAQGALQSSRFELEVKARDLAELLRSFGYHAVALEGGKTSIGIQARWPGGPSDFELSRLNGTLGIKVGEGRLLDVDQGMGRVFGLLSVHALSRRLRLDFSDLYKKGFSFDRIEGTFNINNGQAYTNDLSMNGPSGGVRVRGRTGLAAQDYDQFVTVTPALASSLPLAPAIFIAGQAVPGLPESINKVLGREYRITGPWDRPVITRIASSEAPVAAEPQRE